MGNRLKVDKSLIAPIYAQPGPSQPIDLGAVRVQFIHGGKTYEERAQVAMRFVPNDQLLFVIPAKREPKDGRIQQPMTGDHTKALLRLAFAPDNDWDGKLTLLDKGVVLDAFVKGRGGEHGAIAFMPRMSVVTVTPGSTAISSAVFHLFNFPKFHGPEDYVLTRGAPPYQASTLCDRSVLKGDGWSITIAATDKTDEVCKALAAQGGYVVTHMGDIKREDGAPFTSNQLDDLLRCLHVFLSFVLGCWAGVAFPAGFDSTGRRVFEQWGIPTTAPGPWNGTCSWFDTQHGELLSQVFPGFAALWRDDTWKDSLWKALYWYLAANGQGNASTMTDGGTILAQAALELLAWAYCVQHRRMVSPKAFEHRGGLEAADRLRLLATSLGIPLDIPRESSALHAKAGEKWQDAMHAITGIRNALVHPRARAKLPAGAHLEGWNLSLWYLEMALLRLCGHNGKYSKRLAMSRWTGNVEPVPWASHEAKQGEF